jgi:uncharacterized membrane protein YcaP (DUF421 family)
MDPKDLLMTVVRSIGLYVIMLIVIRMLGKKTVGNFTAFDLLVALMLGEVVDEVIYGDVSFIEGTVAILVIAGAKYFTSYLSFASPRLAKVLEGSPTILVKEGEINKKGLKNELMSESEVHAALRLREIEDMREVKLATLEIDGEVSVIKEDWAEPLQKRDLERQSKRTEDAIPPDKNTVAEIEAR